MNRFLYKYMPLRDDFFDQPMLRATPLRALNDPFEGIFNAKQVQDADRNQRDFYKRNGQCVQDIDECGTKNLLGDIQNDLQDLGIISFTEDYNNPLMWAHYANEHRGLVVEFDLHKSLFTDSLKNTNGRASRFGANYLGEVFEFPERVVYRRDIPDFSRSEFSAPDNMNEFHWRKFNRAILFTKSNDWIYEKEHRSVVRLKDADCVICENNPHIKKLCDKNQPITAEYLKDGRLQVIFPPEYEMHEEMGDLSIKSEVYRLLNDLNAPATHLFKVNPKAISGVYFGCKSDCRAALGKIRLNKSLSHLRKFYRMKINNGLYQLDKTELGQ